MRDDFAVVQNDELFGQSVSFVEILRREQDGRAPFDKTLDDGPEFLAALRIEAGRWFIKEENGRARYQCRGQVESTSHPTRVGLGDSIRRVGQSEILKELVGLRHDVRFVQVVEQSHHSQILEPGEVFVDGGILTGETDVTAHLVRLLDDVEARDGCRTTGRRENGRENSNHRGLSGTVGPQQTKHFAGGHVERHSVEGSYVTAREGAHNIECLHGVVGHCDEFRERALAGGAMPRANRYLLSMAISESEIAQVRAATDIVALISETVALKRTGQRWTGLCPFHGEKTPSFSVNAEEGRYYCFGCRASGDQITWVREIQHLEFVEALRLLADRAGIELHEDANAGPALKERREALDVMERAVAWYHERLLESPDARGAREYLKSRGIGGDVARKFKLGWAPDEWDALASGLKLNEKALLATGLGFVNKRERRQDALRARIIFPIFDPAGKAIAVGGRILPSSSDAPRADGRVEPKYKNSPETSIYSKRRTLYALNFAKDDVIKSGEIIVCEGYTDVIAFFVAGMPRAVATCGTALGEDHFRLMKNFSTRIVLAYDADAAGQNAAASVYQWERQYEVDVYVARLPKGADPADLAQRDPEALRKVIADALPFLGFRLERVLDGANTSTAEGRARAAESAMAVLAEHPSDLVRDQYVQELVGRFGLDQSMLRSRVSELAKHPRERGPRKVPNEPAPVRPQNRPRMPRPGLEALRLYVHGPESFKSRLVAPYFVNEVQREIFDALSSGQSISEVIDSLERRGQDEAAQVLSELTVEQLDQHYSIADVSAVIAQLLRSAVHQELLSLNRDMREGRVSPDVAMATIRDVKEREELLESSQGEVAENDLRHWLIERASLTSS